MGVSLVLSRAKMQGIAIRPGYPTPLATMIQ